VPALPVGTRVAHPPRTTLARTGAQHVGYHVVDGGREVLERGSGSNGW
jgi:hypothetical protein